jgi:hypothetical protein
MQESQSPRGCFLHASMLVCFFCSTQSPCKDSQEDYSHHYQEQTTCCVIREEETRHCCHFSATSFHHIQEQEHSSEAASEASDQGTLFAQKCTFFRHYHCRRTFYTSSPVDFCIMKKLVSLKEGLFLKK